MAIHFSFQWVLVVVACVVPWSGGDRSA